MSRMADERLAEIEIDDDYPINNWEAELLQALKAEREEVERLTEGMKELAEKWRKIHILRR